MSPAASPGSAGTSIGIWAHRRSHRLVARRRLGAVGHADHLAELHGELDRGTRRRQPLLFVAVEQRFSRSIGQNQVELPREVRGVTNAGAHALSRERRHEMRRVAGEQDAAGAPMLGVSGTERVDRVPFETGVRAGARPRMRAVPTRVLRR